VCLITLRWESGIKAEFRQDSWRSENAELVEASVLRRIWLHVSFGFDCAVCLEGDDLQNYYRN